MSEVEARAAETREWLRKAHEDLASARILAQAGLAANALYFCQQAVEKSLKGFLTWHETPFRRTHDLEELGEACGVVEVDLKAALAEAEPLSEYAWKLRYPGAVYVPDADETTAAIEVAARTMASIEHALPAGVRLPMGNEGVAASRE